MGNAARSLASHTITAYRRDTHTHSRTGDTGRGWNLIFCVGIQMCCMNE